MLSYKLKHNSAVHTAWIIRAAVSTLIRLTADYKIGKQISETSDRLSGINSRLSEIDHELFFLNRNQRPPKPCNDCDIFGGGTMGGGGAGGSWGSPKDPDFLKNQEERKQQIKAEKEKFLKDNPDLKERMESLQNEKIELEKEKASVEAKGERLEKIQEGLNKLDPSEIANDVITIIDAQTDDDDESTLEIISKEINKALKKELNTEKKKK